MFVTYYTISCLVPCFVAIYFFGSESTTNGLSAHLLSTDPDYNCSLPQGLPFPEVTANPGIINMAGVVYVFGGKLSSPAGTNMAWRYDPAAAASDNNWLQLGPKPFAKYLEVVAPLNEKDLWISGKDQDILFLY